MWIPAFLNGKRMCIMFIASSFYETITSFSETNN